MCVLLLWTEKRKCATSFVCSCFPFHEITSRLKNFSKVSKQVTTMYTLQMHGYTNTIHKHIDMHVQMLTHEAIKSSSLPCIYGWIYGCETLYACCCCCCSTLTSSQFSFQQHKMPTGGNDAILLEKLFASHTHLPTFERAHLKLKMLEKDCISMHRKRKKEMQFNNVHTLA